MAKSKFLAKLDREIKDLEKKGRKFNKYHTLRTVREWYTKLESPSAPVAA